MTCPVCHGENRADAVFCANPACGKALGDFRYVLEELRAQSRWYEVLCDRIAGFIGMPWFLVIHALWFAAWVALNALLPRPFDAFPFGLLGIILSVEAIFITGVLLISQNRQSAFSDKRAELDYEIAVITHRKLHDLEQQLQRGDFP